MTNHLVKFYTNDDGDLVNDDWHLISDTCTSPCKLCTGEVFGYGEGEATYITKTVERGGITCKQCLIDIKILKAVKL